MHMTPCSSAVYISQQTNRRRLLRLETPLSRTTITRKTHGWRTQIHLHETEPLGFKACKTAQDGSSMWNSGPQKVRSGLVLGGTEGSFEINPPLGTGQGRCGPTLNGTAIRSDRQSRLVRSQKMHSQISVLTMMPMPTWKKYDFRHGPIHIPS